MKKNKLLSAALSVCNIFKLLFIIFIAASTVLLVHWHFSPDTYKDISITLDKTSNAVYTMADDYAVENSSDTDKRIHAKNREAIRITDLNHQSLYVFYLQSVGLLVFWLLIIQEIKSIIKSVKGLETFRSSNSKAFRKIGKYCLGIALLSAFKWIGLEGHSFFGLYFQFMPLAFAMAAFILAEVFEEGNKLYEAEQLTI
ncbi:DUF2975 domain-containing protein [uncultured Pontibacter sp.]|uniref:DUF2975 domain-containing protein n=1 Tax=uncultured Pontibacter sp. TaxID=453356 RepID=UPI0026160950|nr:DUF2975 domain-containing protein [uncultured Pontibacter sp.]